MGWAVAFDNMDVVRSIDNFVFTNEGSCNLDDWKRVVDERISISAIKVIAF